MPTLPHAEESSETWCHLLFLSELQILYLVKQAPGFLKGILCTLKVCEVSVVLGSWCSGSEAPGASWTSVAGRDADVLHLAVYMAGFSWCWDGTTHHR